MYISKVYRIFARLGAYKLEGRGYQNQYSTDISQNFEITEEKLFALEKESFIGTRDY